MGKKVPAGPVSARVLRIELSRGYLDSVTSEDIEVTGSLWPVVRSMASEERADAPSHMREFYSRAGKAEQGAYGYSTGEESCVLVVPAGHPLHDFDYDSDEWSQEVIDDWQEKFSSFG